MNRKILKEAKRINTPHTRTHTSQSCLRSGLEAKGRKSNDVRIKIAKMIAYPPTATKTTSLTRDSLCIFLESTQSLPVCGGFGGMSHLAVLIGSWL